MTVLDKVKAFIEGSQYLITKPLWNIGKYLSFEEFQKALDKELQDDFRGTFISSTDDDLLESILYFLCLKLSSDTILHRDFDFKSCIFFIKRIFSGTAVSKKMSHIRKVCDQIADYLNRVVDSTLTSAAFFDPFNSRTIASELGPKASKFAAAVMGLSPITYFLNAVSQNKRFDINAILWKFLIDNVESLSSILKAQHQENISGSMQGGDEVQQQHGKSIMIIYSIMFDENISTIRAILESDPTIAHKGVEHFFRLCFVDQLSSKSFMSVLILTGYLPNNSLECCRIHNLARYLQDLYEKTGHTVEQLPTSDRVLFRLVEQNKKLVKDLLQRQDYKGIVRLLTQSITLAEVTRQESRSVQVDISSPISPPDGDQATIINYFQTEGKNISTERIDGMIANVIRIPGPVPKLNADFQELISAWQQDKFFSKVKQLALYFTIFPHRYLGVALILRDNVHIQKALDIIQNLPASNNKVGIDIDLFIRFMGCDVPLPYNLYLAFNDGVMDRARASVSVPLSGKGLSQLEGNNELAAADDDEVDGFASATKNQHSVAGKFLAGEISDHANKNRATATVCAKLTSAVLKIPWMEGELLPVKAGEKVIIIDSDIDRGLHPANTKVVYTDVQHNQWGCDTRSCADNALIMARKAKNLGLEAVLYKNQGHLVVALYCKDDGDVERLLERINSAEIPYNPTEDQEYRDAMGVPKVLYLQGSAKSYLEQLKAREEQLIEAIEVEANVENQTSVQLFSLELLFSWLQMVQDNKLMFPLNYYPRPPYKDHPDDDWGGDNGGNKIPSNGEDFVGVSDNASKSEAFGVTVVEEEQ